MNASTTPGVWHLVAVPALITLAVTVLRLVGELLDLPAPWFDSAAGGGGAIVGIGWLVPVFGLWFGWRLARTGRAVDRPGLAAGLCLLGFGALAGGQFLLYELQLGMPQYLVAGTVVAAVALAFAWRAWPAMLATELLYALCARLPVAALTFVLVPMDLGTHYERLPPNIELEAGDRALFLAAGQLVIWVPLTVVVGGMFGALAAFAGRRRRRVNA